MDKLVKINPLLVGKTTNIFRSTVHKTVNSLAKKLTNDHQYFPGVVIDTGIDDKSENAVLSQIIESNQLDIERDELKKWLKYDLTKINNIEDIDERILLGVAKNPAFVGAAINLDVPVALDEKRRELQVCKLVVSNKSGRVVSSGTGFFLTNSLLLTCWHVIGNNTFDDLSVQVYVPHYHGSHPMFPEAIGWSQISYDVKKSLGQPLIHAFSSTLPNDQEKKEWSGQPIEICLDYCVLEIDDSTEKITVSITAPKSMINLINASFSLYSIPNQKPKPNMRKPATLHQASELDGKTVLVHTLTSELKIDSVPGGSISEFSMDFNRVRYGDGSGLEYGDSGSPITNQEGEILAMHNAYTNSLKSQAIPIGAIYEDIKKKNKTVFNHIIT